MLYLSRKIGESIVINNSIEVTLVEVRGKTAKLGFTFPSDASILRKELFEKIRDQNLEASQADDSHSDDDLLAAALGGIDSSAFGAPSPTSKTDDTAKPTKE